MPERSAAEAMLGIRANVGDFRPRAVADAGITKELRA